MNCRPFQASANRFFSFFLFFSPRRFERAIQKRPDTVRCLAVKSTLLGTRHPRKGKEAALQNIVGKPGIQIWRRKLAKSCATFPEISEIAEIIHLQKRILVLAIHSPPYSQGLHEGARLVDALRRHRLAAGARQGGVQPQRGGGDLRPRLVTGCGKLDRARSRLYRSQILQVNMRLKALAEIYTMHSFAQL